jgi:hypothetical protein
MGTARRWGVRVRAQLISPLAVPAAGRFRIVWASGQPAGHRLTSRAVRALRSRCDPRGAGGDRPPTRVASQNYPQTTGSASSEQSSKDRWRRAMQPNQQRCLRRHRRPLPSQPKAQALFLSEDREILVDRDSLARLTMAWQHYDDVNHSREEDLDPVDVMRRAGRVLRAVAPLLRSARNR